MACTHPGPVEQVIHPRDGRSGVRCPNCGMTAYKGDGLMRAFWDALKFTVGWRPK